MKITAILLTVFLQCLAIYISASSDSGYSAFFILLIGFMAGLILNFSNVTERTFYKAVGFGLFYGSLLTVAIALILVFVFLSFGAVC